jgi:hypothetical protein
MLARTAAVSASAAVPALLGGAFLSALEAPTTWFYVIGLILTALVVVQTLSPGSGLGSPVGSLSPRSIGSKTPPEADAETSLSDLSSTEESGVEAGEARDTADRTAAVDVRDLYRRLELDVANGLQYAFSERRIEADEAPRFIETNVLRPIGETLAVALGRPYSAKPRVELGIARQTGPSLTVTHASGPFTHEFKREGRVFVGDSEISNLLERKSVAHFGGDWYAVALGPTEPRDYLFALSSAKFGSAERSSLELHAALVRLTIWRLREVASIRHDAARSEPSPSDDERFVTELTQFLAAEPHHGSVPVAAMSDAYARLLVSEIGPEEYAQSLAGARPPAERTAE